MSKKFNIWFTPYYAGREIKDVAKERKWIPESVQRGFLGASSERSWQSNSPSHSHFFWLRQRPLAQRNSSGPHGGYSTFVINLNFSWRFSKKQHSFSSKRLNKLPGLKAHHIRGIRPTYRHNQSHDRTQSAWGCTACSGTWTRFQDHTCCWCTLEADGNICF